MSLNDLGIAPAGYPITKIAISSRARMATDRAPILTGEVASTSRGITFSNAGCMSFSSHLTEMQRWMDFSLLTWIEVVGLPAERSQNRASNRFYKFTNHSDLMLEARGLEA